MKKFIYFFILFVLIAIIAIETPIFIKYYQREEAIEILEKTQNYINYEIIEKFKDNEGNKIENKIQYRNDIAKIVEYSRNGESISKSWISTTEGKYYLISSDEKNCSVFYEWYDDNIYYPTKNFVDSLRETDLVNLKFNKIDYEGKKCLEITEKDNDSVKIINIETGFIEKLVLSKVK